MGVVSRAYYRGFRLSAGPGVLDVPEWDPFEQAHFGFWVTVIAPNGQRTRFRYWSSAYDYLNGRNRLDRGDLLRAFGLWIRGAQLGELNIYDFCRELGEIEPSPQGRKSFRACRRAYRSCRRLEIPLHDVEFFDGLYADDGPDLVDAVQAVVLGEDPVECVK